MSYGNYDFFRTNGTDLYLLLHSIIGSGSIILPNVKISKNTSIGALSLVKKSILIPGTYRGIPVKKNEKKK